jgi:hypothetical protein
MLRSRNKNTKASTATVAQEEGGTTRAKVIVQLREDDELRMDGCGSYVNDFSHA